MPTLPQEKRLEALLQPAGKAVKSDATNKLVAGLPSSVVNVTGTACRQPDGSWKTVDGTGAAGAMGPDTVFKVQQKLHDQGFYVRDNIDGRWGPKTSAAVQNFQSAKGLQATGQIDSATLAALDLAPGSGQQAQAAPKCFPKPLAVA